MPGVERYSYQGVIQLPAQCPDWVLGFSECCRNNIITNLSSPSSVSMYVEAVINNVGGLCNNSPVFSTQAVPYICAGQPFSFNHGTFDADGDSLAFSLVNPLDAPGVPIPYVSGLSPTNPMVTAGGFAFNPVTGQMAFTPSGLQVGVVTIMVQEFRNGARIGSTMRDIQIIVINCNNNQPQVAGGIQNLTGGSLRDSVTVEVCPGQPLSFQISATDADAGNNLKMTTNISQAFSGATFHVSGSGNMISGTFSWTPTALDTGVNVLTVTVSDSACPIIGNAFVSYQIYVFDGTYAGQDLYYCPAGGPVQLNVYGGTVFSWSPAAGLSAVNISNPQASPTVTTSYVVTSDLSGLCKNKDTVTVFVVPDFILQTSPDDTICRNGSIVLTAAGEAQWAPYTYNWTPAATLLNANTSSPTAFPQTTTTYHLTATSSARCTVRDSVKVTVSGVGPMVEISSDRNYVCPGDSVQLQAIIYPLACGATVYDCSAQNLPAPKTVYSAGATNYTNGSPFFGSEEDVKYQALYLASDLRAAGISTGTITRIDFVDSVKGSSYVYQNLTISLGCTDATELNTSRGWEPVTTVVYGPTVLATVQGVLSFPLQQPYDWDGLSNLVLQICYDNPDTLSPNGIDQLLLATTPNFQSMIGYSNLTNGCTLNPTFRYRRVPKTTFHICDPLLTNFNFSWTPATGLSNPSIINPKAAFDRQTTYTLVASDHQCEGTGFITLNIDNTYGIRATPDTTICGPNPVQLNAVEVGSPPFSTLSCGANGTQCSGTTITRQVGLASSSSSLGTPYRGFWENSRVQILYRASDMQIAGISGSGTISEVAFSIASKQSTTPYLNFTIKMGCTTLNSLSSFVPNLTTVFGPVDYNSAAGWNTHTLNRPYDWDGVSNLLVEICYNNPAGFYSFNDIINYTTTTGSMVVYDEAISTPGCDLTIASATTNRPNTRFKFCAAPPGVTSAVWSPAATLSNPHIRNPVATPAVTTTYTVAYTFINGCTRVDSCTVTVADFNAAASADVSFCKGESAQLSVTGGDAVIWDAIPGLSCYNCRNPIAAPDFSQAYPVTITDASGSCIKRDTVNVTVFQPPPIKFYNDTLYCYIDSLLLDAGTGFATYRWNTNAITPSIIITSPGLYSVTVADSNGCVQSDSIRLDNNIPPTITLGNDTATCLGNSVTIDAPAGFAAYTWSTGSTAASITVFTTGDYSVTVADANSCPAFDTKKVIFSSPNVDFGPDMTLCARDTLLLIAGNSKNSYIWSNGSRDTFIIAAQAGTFSVTATDTLGCVDSDTAALTYHPDNAVNIGPDTFTCNNRPVLFNAGVGYARYVWSNGSIGQTISPTLAGTYSVTVTDINNCTYSDAASLRDETPTVNLGNDTTICQGHTVTFDAGPGFTYQWNNGSSMQSITVAFSDVYAVTVTSGNNCTATDNVRLTVNPLPQPDLGTSDTVCKPWILYPGHFETYQWQDGSGDTIFIVTESGAYSVIVTDRNGCLNAASVDLIVVASGLSLNDILLCNTGDSAMLSAPAAGIASYTWSTGATASSIVVRDAGVYSVTVAFTRNGMTCRESDESAVSFDPMEVTAVSPLYAGISQAVPLVVHVSHGSGSYSYQWAPAETLDDPSAASPVAQPQSNTSYRVTVTDTESGCSDTARVEVIVETKTPEAFTPNGDGINERFQILGGEVLELRIYNRWGELLSEDITGWDGKYQGKDQPIGTYTYYAVLRLANNNTKIIKGVFSLLR